MNKILSFLISIFVEERMERGDFFAFQDLTDHYKKELKKIALDSIIVGSHYHDTKYLIEQYKYHSKRELVDVLVGIYIDIYRQLLRQGIDINKYVIIPVPMHWSRYLIRGYNHTRLLAKKLSDTLHIDMIEPLSTSYRPRQSALSRTSRLANKGNAFRMRNGFSSLPKHIILIDDVISSGATINTCAEILKAHGAEEVMGWCIASNQ